MTTSIYIYLRRSDLVAANACREGLALYDQIAAMRGKREKIRIPWGPLAVSWLDARGNFGTWLVAHGIAPSTATAGDSGTATAGVRGTATAGYGGTATAGDGGTATAGDSGTIAIQYWDPKREKYRTAIAEVGEDGIEPNTAYVLDEQHRFVKKTPTTIAAE